MKILLNLLYLDFFLITFPLTLVRLTSLYYVLCHW